MTHRIIAAATLVPIVVVVVAVALYFAMDWGNSKTGGPLEGRITVWSDRDGDGDIDEKYVMTLDESGVTLLTHYNEALGGDAERSPGDLFTLSINTEQVTEQVQLVGGDASRAPGGLRIFTSNLDGDYEIYVMNPDESGVTLLTHNQAWGEYVFQTPKETVSFRSDGGVGFEEYLATKYGSVTQLTYNEAEDSMASWAPDGRIWFISDRDGDPEIYVMNFDGSGVTQLTHNEAGDGSPSWSPDGQRIAFTSHQDGDAEIYVMNSDGTEVRQLTHNQALDGRPIWSPNGRHIAFTSDRDGDAEIYVMNSDGTEVRQLTHNEAEDFVQNWLPVPDSPSSS